MSTITIESFKRGLEYHKEKTGRKPYEIRLTPEQAEALSDHIDNNKILGMEVYIYDIQD